MPVCKNNKYSGRNVVLEYHIGCGDVQPLESDWKRIGAMRTKEFNAEWDTIDATADDSVGALRENLASFLGLTISGDGTHKVAGADSQNLTDLHRHVLNPVATGGQPVAWMRMTFPDLTFTAFMLVSSMSRSAPYDDIATYSLEAMATASDFGLIIDDTPDPDAPDVTSVTVTPATATLTSGAPTTQLQVVVAPPAAHQAVKFTSSNPAVATVTPQGLVRRIAAGTATITARAVADNTKSGACAVTSS